MWLMWIHEDKEDSYRMYSETYFRSPTKIVPSSNQLIQFTQKKKKIILLRFSILIDSIENLLHRSLGI